ncbi:unnamed protein product [Rangifer tarandus platyrhynchus]|uniref:Uncharacterized protein n=1 Tax=Rangifer tarandus platyrhynchus TaxID=3082113 RepID=A0AC59YCX6_RANTA
MFHTPRPEPPRLLFFPPPPFPPPSCLHFLKEGFFSLSLPHTVAARERAGRAAEFSKK